MNKDEIFLIIFLYTLVVLISSSKPFLSRLGSYSWAKHLLVQLSEPLQSVAEPSIAMIKPVQRRMSFKKPEKTQIAPTLTQNGITTAKKDSINVKEESSKG